jgi:hypothetical protein
VKGIAGRAAGSRRVGFPAANALSHQDWVGESAAASLPRLVDALGEGCSAFMPLLVFLTGSATHGELCGLQKPGGGRRYLSDLDLGIVTEHRVPAPAQRQAASAVAEAARSGPEPRVGFYCTADLDRQDPTLGLVEGVRCGIVLWGDPAHLMRFRVPPPGRIPTAEARRMLANRVLEWLSASRPGRDSLERVYALCKLVADLAAVGLLARGAYEGGGYRDRAFRARNGAFYDASMTDRVEAWTAWRLDPCWDATPLGVAIDDDRLGELMWAEAREAARAGLGICSGQGDVSDFVSGAVPGARTRLRSWKRWIASGAARIAGLRVASLARSPRRLLWGAAIAGVLGNEAESADWLGRLGMDRHGGHGETIERILTAARIMDQEEID